MIADLLSLVVQETSAKPEGDDADSDEEHDVRLPCVAFLLRLLQSEEIIELRDDRIQLKLQTQCVRFKPQKHIKRPAKVQVFSFVSCVVCSILLPGNIQFRTPGATS